ncbi:hypothetical protein U1Q18_045465, partial [Sarracenia purpurea var. burkii]
HQAATEICLPHRLRLSGGRQQRTAKSSSGRRKAAADGKGTLGAVEDDAELIGEW